MNADGFAEAIRANAGHLPEVLLVAGEDRTTATGSKARSMADIPGDANLRARDGDHNVLHALWSRGELRPFLARLMEPGAVSQG
ncbi:MAG: hypothetical protein IPI87_10330 [Betaproteobacteria bacterium]|nr:hypothetical protein [Betaproteobacteria bacterium]